jgi:MFS family permease
MPIWKRNLIFCWFGMFMTGIGMSQIAPILPLYIKHLGVDNPSEIAQLSGIAFGITYVVSAIFSPIWGHAADKFGRKPMLLRASLGMAIIVGGMGFSTNVYILIGLRVLQGAITGYSTSCTTLIATQTDKDNAGYALGTLSTASIAGSLLGPTVGGIIESFFNLSSVFFITGGLLFSAFITTLLFVKEEFVREDKKVLSIKEKWSMVPEKNLTVTMFITFFILTVALYSVEPIITVYIGQLTSTTKNVALISGVAFSASGLANVLAAPKLGKLSDKIGAHKVILVSLICAAIIFIPQAFVKNPWQLMCLRFLLGLTAGGLVPSINILVKKITPTSLTGSIFGLNMSAGYLGSFVGAVLGGQVTALLGIRYVFIITSILLAINSIWVYFKVYKKSNIERLLLTKRQ